MIQLSKFFTCVCLVCILLPQILLAQNEAKIWYFGRKSGLDFRSGSPVALSDGQIDTDKTITATEGTATIADAEGNLLFYTDGQRIWNKHHQVMPNGTGLNGNYSSSQSAIIIPKPGDPSTYYVFTASDGGYINRFEGNKGICFSEVNMCLSGGLGDVVVGRKNLFLYKNATEKLTATFHANGKDVWVITHEYNTNRFVSYLVTASGVNQPLYNTVGQVHAKDDVLSNTIGFAKFSPQGDKLAISVSFAGFVELFDFDNNTGILSNPRVVFLDPTIFNTYSTIYGLEFSPNGNQLYVASAGNYTRQTQYMAKINLLAGTAADISNSATRIVEKAFYEGRFGSLQLATDGKIYVIKHGIDEDYMGIIHNPDAESALNTNYQDLGVKITKVTGLNVGLPGFISNYFDKPALIYYGNCTTLTKQFDITSSKVIQTVSWDFGDPDSRLANISNQIKPFHTFSEEGLYQVSAQISFSDGTTKKLSCQLRVALVPPNPLGRDTTLCQGQTLTLDVSKIKGNFRWQDGTTNPTFKVTKPGIYWIEVCNYTCRLRDSIQVFYRSYYNPTLDLDQDKISCNNQPITLNATIPEGKYKWQDGSSAATFTATQSGKYWVTATNDCGMVSDTVQITFYPVPPFMLGNDTLLCAGSKYKLDISKLAAAGFGYKWSARETSPVLEITEDGIYRLELTSGTCIFKDEIRIDFEECMETIKIPNMITPNGDTWNQTFAPEGLEIGKWGIEIYNRLGALVYKNEAYRNEWQADNLENGTYFYYLKDKESKMFFRGYIAVFR